MKGQDRPEGVEVEHAPSVDYSHWFHAGNVGDVWKHCALLALLARRGAGPCLYLETHAGQGRYQLAATGEWTEGAGRLLALAAEERPAAVGRYLDALGRLGFDPHDPRGPAYPGSPQLALGELGAGDRALFFELAAPAAQALMTRLATEARAKVRDADGLAALPAVLEADRASVAERLVLIDPPYTAKSEWIDVPAALLAAWRVDPGSRFLLWYPIKSLTRPNAMLALLQREGVPATALDLITTPLELRRNRLNGSGLLLVNPPPGLVPELAAAAPVIGAACATHGGRWSTRALSWA